MNLHIRQATSTDAETITRLVQQLAAENHGSSPIHAQYVAAYRQSAVGRVYLAEDDGQVVWRCRFPPAWRTQAPSAFIDHWEWTTKPCYWKNIYRLNFS